MKEQPLSQEEIFSIPQADGLVVEENFSPEFVKNLEKNSKVVLSDEEGQPIIDAKEVLSRLFYEEGSRKIENLELLKTKEEVELIQEVKNVLEDFAQSYGRTNFVNLPEDNIHFLKEGGAREFTEEHEGGSYSIELGRIIIDRRQDNLSTAISLFHEMWHMLASHNEIHTTSDGFSICGGLRNFGEKNSEKKYLRRIDEALTGKMTKRFFNEHLRKDDKYRDSIEEKIKKGDLIDTTRQNETQELEKIIASLFKVSPWVEKEEDIWEVFFRVQVTGDNAPLEDFFSHYDKNLQDMEEYLESCFTPKVEK